MWSFKIVCSKECDLKSCKSLDDFIKNLDDCRGNAAVKKYIAVVLSVIPLTGLGNFYSGNKFDGIFELAEGIIVLISICCCCIHCRCDENGDDSYEMFTCELFCSYLLMLINIVRFMVYAALTYSFDSYKFCLMITTVVISLIFSCCGCATKEKICWIAPIIVNVVVVVLMELIRDVYIAASNENDWNGCPFI